MDSDRVGFSELNMEPNLFGSEPDPTGIIDQLSLSHPSISKGRTEVTFLFADIYSFHDL